MQGEVRGQELKGLRIRGIGLILGQWRGRLIGEEPCYRVRGRTKSIGIKGLCAQLHYSTKVRILISRCKDIRRFIPHLQSVSIKQRLQIQSGGLRRNGVLDVEGDRRREKRYQLIRGDREILWRRRMWSRILYRRWRKGLLSIRIVEV